MAKRRSRQTGEAASPTVGTVLPPALMRQIEALRRPFTAFAQRFAAITEQRSALAPQFMRVYHSFGKAKGGTFVAFVRLLDPQVPAERAAYRAHPSYQAADYLRRLVARAEQTQTGQRRQPATRSNLTNLARSLATVLPLLRDQAVLWRAVEQEFAFTARQITRLREVVSGAQPLISLQGVRPATRVQIVHAEPPAAAEGERAAA